MKLSWYVTALGAAIVWGVHYPLLDHALKRLSLFTVLFLTVLPMLLAAPFFMPRCRPISVYGKSWNGASVGRSC